MKSSRMKKATGVLLAAFALAASGCGSSSKDEGKTLLPSASGGGTRQITATAGASTGGTATGGTTGGGGSTGGGGLSPALIMTIVN